MPKLVRDSVAIHYEIHGTSGPVLLLSHGYSSTARMWDGQIAALKDRYRVIVWDMRGHGESDTATIGPSDDRDLADTQTRDERGEVVGMRRHAERFAFVWPRVLAEIALAQGNYATFLCKDRAKFVPDAMIRVRTVDQHDGLASALIDVGQPASSKLRSWQCAPIHVLSLQLGT